MIQVEKVKSFLIAPFVLMKWSVVFYFTHWFILCLGLIPSFVRGYQKYTGSHDFEWIVWIGRLLFLIWVIKTGIKEKEKINWGEIHWQDFAIGLLHAIWSYIFIQYIIFNYVNRLFSFIITESSMTMILNTIGLVTIIDASGLTASILFFLKNTIVIPLYLIALLRIIKVI
ncbi:hypothetical protein SAMN05444392_10697 [Seinonella peptonophila]|uniref:Uncharacterized protein n=1 Tax=Seinonella peptonophila TaxID=112248 RepID=A0A1M4Y877_9BACL|nr:hypothetical protein [Seinonella peptonophila]SHF01869.1 hypothetical protein SAMN05444392_10697 [Seinonella peptonophila]